MTTDESHALATPLRRHTHGRDTPGGDTHGRDAHGGDTRTHHRPQAGPAGTPLLRFTVTLRDSREALGRIVSALRPVPVRELTYAVRAPARATAEVVVSSPDADRARRRLHRLVDVLAVVESDADATSAR